MDIKIKVEMPVETKLGTLEWKKQPEANIHLKNSGADSPCVTKCDNKPCTTVCPAKVYEWEAAHKKVIVNYENCIECGACRMLCPWDNITCEWPGGGQGIKYKYG
ncbi:MAG TPA: 4Fe-4S dicluster domain-containing protein [Elusimicrobiota bacterium]|jgi:ferredoxin like protein|nr:4Fe-4S dicluster domain-containing protein [Elusimicrobiota bacterium]